MNVERWQKPEWQKVGSRAQSSVASRLRVWSWCYAARVETKLVIL